MKFLIISDLHGNISALEKLDGEFKAADAVLFGGDFAAFNHTETGLPAIEALCKKHDVIFSVIGNCDEPEFLKELEKRDVSVENTLAYLGGVCIAGSGGGSKFTGTTPNERTEEELLSDFSVVEHASGGTDKKGAWNNLILISHNPPKDTKCDAVNPALHAGSQKFRELIERLSPLAVVTGHIHEGAAIDTIGSTTIINPGALLDGKYAVMETAEKDGAMRIVFAELRTLD